MFWEHDMKQSRNDDYSTLLVRFYGKIHVSWKQIFCSFTKFENGFGCESKCKNIFGSFGTFCTFLDTNDVVYTFFFCPPKQVHVEKRDYSTDTDGHKM